MDRKTSKADEYRFCRILRTHFRRYPEMSSRDLYKLAYQAAFGSSHAITDEKKAAEHLQNELSNLRRGVPEPIFDVLSPDGTVARVNLRPYADLGGEPGNLLKAFIRTAEDFTGSSGRMETVLDLALNESVQKVTGMDPEGLRKFFDQMKELGYPAAHHSDRYRELYSPAYRVIATNSFKYLDIP
ncbi:MAG: hypothetical protein GF388_03365 [Candidatus Aegiribacteria sp.]|nr:hypothetical protein [Candidatus Aegiribacteria sp.]